MCTVHPYLHFGTEFKIFTTLQTYCIDTTILLSLTSSVGVLCYVDKEVKVAASIVFRPFWLRLQQDLYDATSSNKVIAKQLRISQLKAIIQSYCMMVQFHFNYSNLNV